MGRAPYAAVGRATLRRAMLQHLAMIESWLSAHDSQLRPAISISRLDDTEQRSDAAGRSSKGRRAPSGGEAACSRKTLRNAAKHGAAAQSGGRCLNGCSVQQQQRALRHLGASRVRIAPPPPQRQQSAADIRLTSLSGMQAPERRPRSAGRFVAFAGSVHLASFLRAVSRKSLISLICFGCEHASPSTTRQPSQGQASVAEEARRSPWLPRVPQNSHAVVGTLRVNAKARACRRWFPRLPQHPFCSPPSRRREFDELRGRGALGARARGT
jgi:hypothetical protein